MILINPWDHIDKDENAWLESESNFLIGSIREYLEQYPWMCFIFWGSGEMELLGAENVIKEGPNRKKLQSIIDQLKKKTSKC